MDSDVCAFWTLNKDPNSFKVNGKFRRMLRTDEEKLICECESREKKTEENPKENDEL